MEHKGKIKFYEETMDVLFPEDFNLCVKKLGEMIGLPEDEVLKKINLYYNDEDEDKVVLSGDADYEIFINYVKENENKKEKITLNLELKENSEVLVKKMSKDFSNYKQKFSNEVNIENKDSMEIKEEFNNIINEDNKNNDNDNNNDIKNNIDNNKDDFEENQNENNNINNNNIIIDEKKTNNEVIPPPEINDLNEPAFTYPETCYNCKANPLYDIFYYCTLCNQRICSKCELVLGPQHPHPIYKIQTFDQYMNSDIKIEAKFWKGVKDFAGNAKEYIGILNNIVNNNNNINNNINNNDYKEKIKKMRNENDLSNITDEQIKEALKKANGDTEKAIGFIFN